MVPVDHDHKLCLPRESVFMTTVYLDYMTNYTYEYVITCTSEASSARSSKPDYSSPQPIQHVHKQIVYM